MSGTGEQNTSAERQKSVSAALQAVLPGEATLKSNGLSDATLRPTPLGIATINLT